MEEDKPRILWIEIPEKVLEKDLRWIYASQKEYGYLEEIIRNFVLRHPEILTHPKIVSSTLKQKMKIVGVELGLRRPDEHDHRPDAVFSRGRTYYVIEAKSKLSSEPEAKRTAIKHYEDLKLLLETKGEPFDSIIPVVVFGGNSERVRSRYHDSFTVLIEELNLLREIQYYPHLRKSVNVHAR